MRVLGYVVIEFLVLPLGGCIDLLRDLWLLLREDVGN